MEFPKFTRLMYSRLAAHPYHDYLLYAYGVIRPILLDVMYVVDMSWWGWECKRESYIYFSFSEFDEGWEWVEAGKRASSFGNPA
jgi:hypothetical protein